METTIYHYALCVSLTLMLFFSYRFIFGRLPDSELYRPYRQSRSLMGWHCWNCQPTIWCIFS